MARQTAQKYFWESSRYLFGVWHTCLEFEILFLRSSYLWGVWDTWFWEIDACLELDHSGILLLCRGILLVCCWILFDATHVAARDHGNEIEWSATKRETPFELSSQRQNPLYKCSQINTPTLNLGGLAIFEKLSPTPDKYLYLHRSVSISKKVAYYPQEVTQSLKKYLPSPKSIFEPFGAPYVIILFLKSSADLGFLQTEIATKASSQSLMFRYSVSPAARQKALRPVLFVVQVMSDIRKQYCIHNKRIPQCTKWELHSSSITLMTSKNHQLTLVSVEAGYKSNNLWKY